MDTITQGLLGAAVVQTGLRQKIGRDASWVAAIAAVMPDLDIMISPIMRFFGNGNPMDMMVYHRGVTHSLLAVPFIAALVALPWWLIRRRFYARRLQRCEITQKNPPVPSPSYWLLFLCCLAAVATHALLDACTSYGTQLFWPFAQTRVAWDCIAIIDPLYSLILIVTLMSCYILRKIFRKNPARSKRVTIIVGIVGMLLSTGYLAAGRVCHDIAIRQGIVGLEDKEIVEANAYPMIGSLMLWRVVVETPDQWIVSRVHFLADSQKPLRRNTASVLNESNFKEIQLAKEHPMYKTFAWFSGDKLRPEVFYEKDVTIVDFHDMRYSTDAASVEGLWHMRFVYDSKGELIAAGRTSRFHHRNRYEFLKKFWKEMWTP